MFELVMLGTSSANPTVHRNLPAIAVRKEGQLLLLDCGEGTQRQMMLYGVSYMKVSAIFLSHLHLDHCLGVFGLIETMALNGRTNELKIFGPKGTSALLEAKYELHDFAKVQEIAPGFEADFGQFFVRAIKVLHTKNSLGFILQEKDKIRFYEEKAHMLGLKGPMFSEILRKGQLPIGGRKVSLKEVTYVQKGKKIAYSGDTLPSPEFAKAAKEADLLIHEATFSSEFDQEAKDSLHSTAAGAAWVAKKAGAKRLILTHISSRFRDPTVLLEEARAIFPSVEVAYDGMKLQV
ncbi:MAG: ribonuclease Z [Candidatus Micrarchaeota archaeon]|nr:ribonuclease Z [Candidatus Micrarchaeota archaeon]